MLHDSLTMLKDNIGSSGNKEAGSGTVIYSCGDQTELSPDRLFPSLPFTLAPLCHAPLVST